MLLTLEVVSANGEALGPNRRKTVGPEGARIGRAKENDWVIVDQYISRVNARISYMNGAFYIEGLGRNPLALHEPNNTVANNELQPLGDGDRFFLDQFEIRASISAGQTVANRDPFGHEPAIVVPNARPTDHGFGGVAIGEGGNSDSTSLDPLAVLLGGGDPTPVPTPPKHVELHQRSPIEDIFNPPPIANSGFAPTGIPNDWFDDPSLKQPRPPSRPPAEPPARPAGGPSTVIPGDWNKSGFTQIGLMPQKQPTAPKEAPPRIDDPLDIGATGPGWGPHVEPPPAPRLPPAPPQAPPPPMELRPRPAPPRAPPVEAVADATSSLGQLLRAAGLPSAQMTPEIAAEIGEALRIVVQGVMDVLHARAEIKSELRMSMTRMQAHENNPLKFSPNVESALHTLLVERNRGYMPTTRAFQEAFNDIRNHQIAVLHGTRVAFESLLRQFHPDTIETQMEAHGRRSVLNLGSKARFRDYYGELFEQLMKDPDASFRRLFNEPFAQAYEEQMEDLAQSASRRSRGQE